jgi:hypothetical protein
MREFNLKVTESELEVLNDLLNDNYDGDCDEYDFGEEIKSLLDKIEKIRQNSK